MNQEELILNKQRDNAFNDIQNAYEKEIVSEKERYAIDLQEEHENWIKEIKNEFENMKLEIDKQNKSILEEKDILETKRKLEENFKKDKKELKSYYENKINTIKINLDELNNKSNKCEVEDILDHLNSK